MNEHVQVCSFCGLKNPGGVQGETETTEGRRVYICPECIDLCHQLKHGPPLQDGP